MTDNRAKDLRELIYLLYGKYVRGLEAEALRDFVQQLDQDPSAWKAALRQDALALKQKGGCAHCGADHDVQPFPLVPPERAGNNLRLKRILSSPEASVPSCAACRQQQDGADVLEWYGADLSSMPKMVLHALLETLYQVHLTQGTLDTVDPNQDGQLDIYDLGVVMSYFIMPKGKKTRERPGERPGDQEDN